jgi:DNA polymerase elongation subunit (family B)
VRLAYSACHKVDVASLYPSIMIQYEVFDEDKDPSKYFLNLVKLFTEAIAVQRKLKKINIMTTSKELIRFLLIVVMGFLGTSGLLFNSPHAAAFITETGREVLQTSIHWAKSKGYTIVNADTDSITYSDPNKSLVDASVRKSNIDELNSLYPESYDSRMMDSLSELLYSLLRTMCFMKEDGSVKIKGSALKDSKREQALKEFANEIITILLSGEDVEKVKDVYYKYIREVKYGITDIKQLV